MKYYLILILIVLLIIPGAVLASDIRDALFSGNIQVSNNGTAANNVSVNLSLDSESLIDVYGVDTAFDYVAIRNTGGDDVPFMPSVNSSYPWCLWVPSINENSRLNDILYTGQTDLGATKYYFPGDGGMSVSDNTALEVSNNSTIEYSAYFVTDAPAVFIVKPGSYGIGTYGTGNITAGVNTATNPSSTNDPSTQWTDDNKAIDDITGTWAYDAVTATNWSSYLEFLHASFNVMGVRIWPATGTPNANDRLEVDLYYDGDWHNIYSGSFTNGAWNDITYFAADVTNARARIYVHAGGAANIYEFDYYTAGAEVTCAANSGEHDIKTVMDGTNHYLYIDDMVTPVDTAALGGASSANNTLSWQIGDDDSTPYIETANITVAGVLGGSWRWEYDTKFTDLSGNGNDGTPTFRTDSSDPDVTANLISFRPVSEASAEYSLGLDWPTMITTAPDQPLTMYTENSTPGVFFAGFIDAIWTPSGVPVSFFWYNFTFATIIIAGIFVFRINQSLLLKTIVMATIMIAWALPGPNVYGFYVVIYFAMYSAGLMILSRSYGW